VNECLVVCLYSGTQRELFNKGHTSDLEPHPSREPPFGSLLHQLRRTTKKKVSG